jgi:UDP-N-acetylmuramyl pentapeptide synthase
MNNDIYDFRDVILLKGSRGMGMERVLEMTYRESVVQSGGGG